MGDLNYIESSIFLYGNAADAALIMENTTTAAVPNTVDPVNALTAAAIALAVGVLIYIYRRRRQNSYE